MRLLPRALHPTFNASLSTALRLLCPPLQQSLHPVVTRPACSAVRYKTSGPDVIADPRPKVEKDTGINVAQYVQVR
jgi:hypothetical protein